MHRSVVVVLLLSATIALSIASPRRIHTGVEGDATAQTAAQTVPDVTAAPNAEVEAPATPEQLEPLANGETNAEEEEEEEAYHEEEAVVPHVAAKEHVSVAENAVEKVEPAVAETQEPVKTHDEAPLAAAAAAAEEVETVKPLTSDSAKTADYAEAPAAEQSALKEVVGMLAECYKKATSFLSSAVESVSH
ncbi:uncharacterized protein LOC118465173 [Anopheles albimanus]|uniref:uncharacterized protein LOC118465173 n=1 Tax=Anopheles albimanus TaxID=7167 RepID=UPI00163ED42B|nr:uncharacterized protein LOC118465173 [Anopheles albimanus]